MAATVVVLPDPVGPQTSSRPRGSRASAVMSWLNPSRAERRHRRRQGADGRRHAPAFEVEVHPEAAQLAFREREIDRVAALELALEPRRYQRFGGAGDGAGRQIDAVHGVQAALGPHHRRAPGDEQQIAAVQFAHGPQPAIDRVDGGHSVRVWPPSMSISVP